MRELLAMAEGRIDQQWQHTASLLAMLANTNRDPKKGRLLTPADFHPSGRKPSGREPVLKGDIQMLKRVFVDQSGRSA